jgi:adenylylsulfate kinase-like enzyme
MVKITIEAPPKSGTSALAAFIAKHLEGQGKKVNVDDGDKNVAQHNHDRPDVWIATVKETGERVSK